MKPHILLLSFCLFCCHFVFAQDTIFMRNKTILIGTISEINLDDVKYKPAGSEKGPVIAVDKDDILKIVFQNGMVQKFMPAMEDPSRYANNHKNAIKIDFLAPMFYKTTFAYERSLKPGMSIETTLGIIGLGHNPESEWRKSAGAFLKFGVKFIKSPDYYLRGMKYAHILKGGYIKPEIIVGAYSDEIKYYDYSSYAYSYSYTTTEKKSVTNFGLHLVIGKQWIYSNVFLLDIYGGVGYGFDNLSDNSSYPYIYHDNSNQYDFIKEPGSPFSFSGGMKIGFLFR